MIRLPRANAATRQRRAIPYKPSLTGRARLLWTVGNFCTLSGIVILLYVGGLYANDEYGRYAARGDSDVPAPVAVDRAVSDEPAPFVAAIPSSVPAVAPTSAAAEPAPLVPSAAAPKPTVSSAVQPSAPVAAAEQLGTVTRLVIPTIAIDSKVVNIGWDYQQQGDALVPIWEVAKYAVGHHRGSANPGEGENIVLAGHVGGYGHVFRDLFYVRVGEPIVLYSNGKAYNYKVKQRLVVLEDGATPEQQAANAKLIEPTGSEMVTLITCWPATGKDKFTKRVVVQAVPDVAG